MTTDYPKIDRHRRRTVSMPESRARAIRLAAEYLGISGETLIQKAITDELRSVYEQMINELP
jgi:hypothetical protein